MISFRIEQGKYFPPLSKNPLEFEGVIEPSYGELFRGELDISGKRWALNGRFYIKNDCMGIIALADKRIVLDLHRKQPGLTGFKGDYSGECLSLPYEVGFNQNPEEFRSRISKLRNLFPTGVMELKLLPNL